MTKRLVDIDDDLIAAAQAAAGKETIEAAVRHALELLVEQRNRRDADLRHKWAALGHSLDDLHADDVMHSAWT